MLKTNNRTRAILLLMTIAPVVHSSSAVSSYRIGEDRHQEIKPFQNLPQGGTLNLTFRSKIDGSIQPLLVKIPEGYTPAESWP